MAWTSLGVELELELAGREAHGLSCQLLMYSHITSWAVGLTSTLEEVINIPLWSLGCCALMSVSFPVCKLVINYLCPKDFGKMK